MSQINDRDLRDVEGGGRKRTQRLYVILIKAPFDVLDHQARFSDLRVPNHAHFDDDAARR